MTGPVLSRAGPLSSGLSRVVLMGGAPERSTGTQNPALPLAGSVTLVSFSNL